VVKSADPDAAIKQLNWWWSEGFDAGMRGEKYDRERPGTHAERDQFFRGLMTGRETRSQARDA
jgi:hypothetical protein